MRFLHDAINIPITKLFITLFHISPAVKLLHDTISSHHCLVNNIVGTVRAREQSAKLAADQLVGLEKINVRLKKREKEKVCFVFCVRVRERESENCEREESGSTCSRSAGWTA